MLALHAGRWVQFPGLLQLSREPLERVVSVRIGEIVFVQEEFRLNTGKHF